MSEPISWQVLEWLKTRIAAVTTANGFLTNLGAGEIALDREHVREADAPSVQLFGLEFPQSASGSTKSTHLSEMEITVEFQIPYLTTESPMKLAHRGRSDLLRVLSGNLFGAPEGFRSLEVTGSSITPPEGGATTVVAQVTARAGLAEPLLPAA